MTTLLEFINARRVRKGQIWNVTGMAKNDKGIYNVVEGEYDEFLRLYYDWVFVKGNKSALLERHTEYSPILIDLDFKYAKNSGLKRRFTMKNVATFIGLYMEVFDSFVSISGALRFFVMLKSGPRVEKGLIRDGIHIVCPDVALPASIMIAIRLILLEQGAIEACFDGLVNNSADAFDESVIERNNWFFYGAGKPDAGVYNVVACFHCSGTAVEEERLGLNNMELVKLLSIRRQDASEYTIKQDKKDVWLMWEKALKSGSDMDTDGDSVDVDSAKISSILRVEDSGTWRVTLCGTGYKLLFSNRLCLVNSDVVHSTWAHSCIFVNSDGATACCFSHWKMTLVEEGLALWRFLSGFDECLINF